MHSDEYYMALTFGLAYCVGVTFGLAYGVHLWWTARPRRTTSPK